MNPAWLFLAIVGLMLMSGRSSSSAAPIVEFVPADEPLLTDLGLNQRSWP